MSLIRFQTIFLTSHRGIFRNHLNEEIEKVTKISALFVDSWIFLLLYILIGFVNQKTCQFFSWIRLHHRSSITYQCISAFCQSMEIFEGLRNSLLYSSFNKKKFFGNMSTHRVNSNSHRMQKTFTPSCNFLLVFIVLFIVNVRLSR